MKNFIQAGENITIAAPSIIASGEGVLVGSLYGIANGAAELGANVVLSTTGVFDMTKNLTDDIGVGDILYWDDTAKAVTIDDDSGANVKVGVAVTVAANPSSAVRVRLNGSF